MIINKRTVIASGILFLGILCGILENLDNGLWAVILAKDNSVALALVGGVVGLFSMFGTVTSFYTTGSTDSPLPFWIGQLAFYGALFLAIQRGHRK